MNQRMAGWIITALVLVMVLAALITLRPTVSRPATAAAAVVSDFGVVRNGTVTDVEVGRLYELDQPVGISLKDTSVGRVYEVGFGGRDRNRRPMYVYSQDLEISTDVPLGTIRWVPESSYRELEGIVYDNSTNVRVRALVNLRPGQMVTERSFRGGQVRGRR